MESAFEIRFGDVNSQLGVWKRNFGVERKIACVSCPVCGTVSALIDHKIDSDGFVTPSIICPRCGFHENIRLLDWKGDSGDTPKEGSSTR